MTRHKKHTKVEQRVRTAARRADLERLPELECQSVYPHLRHHHSRIPGGQQYICPGIKLEPLSRDPHLETFDHGGWEDS